MSDQLSFPVDVSLGEIARCKDFGAAIDLCAAVAGFDLDKSVSMPNGIEKGHFSRMKKGTEGIKWPKLKTLMAKCGNDVPVLWMAYDVGFDLASIRKRETETQRENRLLREENAALRRVLMGQGS